MIKEEIAMKKVFGILVAVAMLVSVFAPAALAEVAPAENSAEGEG